MPKPSGTFEPYVPPGFASHQRRILYVGKATAGSFDDKDASANAFGNVNSAFWRLARSISQLADPNCKDLSNLAWSNIFKQGVQHGNPLGDFAEAQRADSIATLRREVIELKPTLIVLVNADYYEEIPKEAYDIIEGEVGEKALTRTIVAGEEKYDLWSRAAFDIYPPIVWMYHPQGKRTQYLEAALVLVQRITEW